MLNRERPPTRNELVERIQVLGAEMYTTNNVENMELLIIEAFDCMQLLYEDHEIIKPILSVVK